VPGGQHAAFTVTEGPKELTVEDFWRLVWQEQPAAVVMLTRTFEFIKIMCVQYWPVHLNKKESYGSFDVVMICEEPLAHYRVRQFVVEHAGEKREVSHYQYHEWPEHSCPPPNMLLQFRRRLLQDLRPMDNANRNEEDEDESLLPRCLVHCSDGASRSGMFVGLMHCLAEMRVTGSVDVFAVVRRLISQRRSLISEPTHIQ